MAAALNKPDGAVRPTMRKLVDAGVLREVALPNRRAVGYEVAPAWRSLVAESEFEPRQPVGLAEGTRLLEVSGDLGALAVELANASDARAFGWAARVDVERFLVALSGPSHEMDDIHVRLRGAGLKVEAAYEVRQMFSPQQLRGWGSHLDRYRPPGDAPAVPATDVTEEGDGGAYS
jgi:hypothetical protein